MQGRRETCQECFPIWRESDIFKNEEVTVEGRARSKYRATPRVPGPWECLVMKTLSLQKYLSRQQNRKMGLHHHLVSSVQRA